MKRIATWIRPKTVVHFRDAFAGIGGLELRDAAAGQRDFAGADGLLLTGGEDVSAGYLRQPVPDPTLIRDPFPERDAWEFAAVADALQRGIPILAICRGHQLLNVAAGGTLILDLPGHSFPEKADVDIHALIYEAEVPAWRRFSPVNSTHHQAVDRPASGFRIEARSAADGIIEQMSVPDHRFCVGVQYHPERSAGYRPLFEAFAAAC